MKTLKISNEIHRKLTAMLGESTAQTMKTQTYQDAIEALLTQSAIVLPELLREVEDFIAKNKHKGYTRKEEFIRQAIRFFLRWESEEYDYFEIPKEKYEKLKEEIDELNMLYMSPWDFIEDQIDKVMEQYGDCMEQTEKNRRRVELNDEKTGNREKERFLPKNWWVM